MEPSIELLLAEVNGIVRLLLSRHGITVYKEYENVVWNAKTLPKLSFKKKFGEMLRPGVFETRTFSTTFLAFINHTDGSNVPSY